MTLSQLDDALRRAVSAMRAGKADAAERLFKKVLRSKPRHVGALNLMGVLLTQSGRFGEAETYLRAALNEGPTSDATFYNYGLVLKALNRPVEALEAFSRALQINGSVAEAWNNRGTVFNDLKRFREAVSDFDRATAISANYADAFFNKGNALAELKLYSQAVAAYDRALALKPDLTEAWLGRGNVLTELRQYDGAAAAFDRVLALKPDLAGGWLGRGNVFAGLKRYDEAFVAYEKALTLKSDLAEAWLGRGNVLIALERQNDVLAAYDKALALRPDLAKAWLGRGNACALLKRYDEAFAAYDRSLALEPELAEAWLDRGNLFGLLKRYDAALADCEKAVALRPDLAEVWLGRGNLLIEIKQYEDALISYDRALAIAPNLAEAWAARGRLMLERGRYEDAFLSCDKAVELKPDTSYAAGPRLLAKLYLCDWRNLQAETAQLLSMVSEQMPVSTPFCLLPIQSSADDQLRCARRYLQDQPNFTQARREVYSHDRIRVAYLSADFREHATAYLTAGFFENHDRSRFEITAISFGPDSQSAMRQRISGACERFVDVSDQSDQDVADLVRRLEIDIAVDLMGFTANNRLGVLARRPAPVQVNYLGYPGTMGADFMDYILADPTVIPEEQCAFYSEQVIWLPDSYQINDQLRFISEATPTRRDCSLPDTGLVFCCFNNSFKIMPDIFDIWMRLLKTTNDSVLWLLDPGAATSSNLSREAEKRGVSAQRLVFAGRTDLPDHLARHRLADLFLDTLPYNAHTTASDALWAGVPVLTCCGNTFAGRVAASLLKAIGLDELITHSLEDYEALALKLAHDRPYLESVKEKLALNRNTFPLFDTARATRNIEAAYTAMWECYQKGESAKPRSGEPKPIRIA